MAIAATIAFEVRTTGSDNNGGGYKAGAAGTDRSQQNAAQVAIDNAAITTSITTNVITFSAGYTPSSADVGNVVQMLTGTNVTAGFYEITAQTSTTWTVDRNVVTSGTTTNATGNMGGALASPGKAGSGMVAGNDLYLKSGTYTVTSASSNVAAGCTTIPAAASASNVTKVIGYTTTRTDGAPTRPIVKADGVITTFTLLTLAANTRVEGIEFDGNSRTSSRGINSAGTNNHIFNCVFRNFTNSGIVGNSLNRTTVVNCYATTCSTASAFVDGIYYGCVASGNTISGFASSGNLAAFVGCISASNSGAASDGFVFGSRGQAINCTAYGNGRDGFRLGGANNPSLAINCLAVGNAAYGFSSGGTADDNGYLHYCAGYNNTSGNVNSADIPASQQLGFIALSGDPFVNAAGGNFALNSTAGGGAALRALGYPSSFIGISTNHYPDVGAAQSQPGGGTKRVAR